jgi:methoxymalonate biosynthesis acyl carrier protein
MPARERIKAYFSRTVHAPIADDADIFELGLVDSLFAMQLVMFVENEFAIVAQREDLHIRNFCSIAALTKFVEAKLANGLAAHR